MSSAAGVPGLLLAAGRSRRMPGASKLALRWDDTTVLGAVTRAARAAGLSPVVVVAREAADPAEPDPPDRRILVAAGGGRADSLAEGLAAIAPGPLVVLLGDEPGLRPEVVRRLVRRCRDAPVDAARVRYADRPGHPVWLAPAARAVARRLAADAAVWEAVASAGLRTFELPVEGPAPIDVDSPEALAQAREARRIPDAPVRDDRAST